MVECVNPPFIRHLFNNPPINKFEFAILFGNLICDTAAMISWESEEGGKLHNFIILKGKFVVKIELK